MGSASDAAAAAGRSAGHRYRAVRRQARVRRLACRALVVVAGVLAGLAVAAGATPRSVALGAAAVLAGLTAVLVRPRPDPERWSRGADGERATAAMLERLPARRWVVLHDRQVPGSAANIDHLIVGPTGVWVVDTKTYRLPVRPRWRTVWVGGRRLDTGPAAWEAEVVGDRLHVAVTPVVAIHGTGLKARGRRCGGVRVVPAWAVVRRVRRGRRVLSRDQVAALAEQADRLLPPARTGSLSRG